MRWGDYPDGWDDRREHVLERDDYECQRCGATDGELQVHHRMPISEGGGHELANLETVCRSCHAAEHSVQVAISEALADNKRLRMKYHSSSGTRVRELDPYGMAMHEGIQYIVGYDFYRKEIRVFRPTRIDWAETLSESFSPPPDWDTSAYLAADMGYQRTADGGCFIATAAYGSPDAPEIEVLSRFRDTVLASSRASRWTIPLYYAVSPTLARWIARSARRQWLARRLLVTPAVGS